MYQYHSFLKFHADNIKSVIYYVASFWKRIMSIAQNALTSYVGPSSYREIHQKKGNTFPVFAIRFDYS